MTKMKVKFDLGQTVMTSGISDYIKRNPEFDLASLIARHACGDWGDLIDEDKAMNDNALDPECPFRLFSKYDISPPYHGNTSIYIITEWDRSVTTVLFPSEY